MKTVFWKQLYASFEAFLDADGSRPDEGRLEKIFYILAAGWLVLWTLLPSLCVGNAFIDVSENVAWGQHFQFGYDKNPYFGAWLTYWSYRLIPSECVSYFLSQCSVLLAVVSMWKLGRDIFRNRFHALAAVLLMLLIPYHSHSACEFNDDVIEIGLWALFILFFHRAVEKQRIGDWLMVGLAAGLAFMTKYLGAALFLSLGVLLVFTARGRQSWKRWGIYLAGAVFLVLVLPNIVWLFRNDFIAFRYAAQRAELDQEITLLSHLTRPLELLLGFASRLILPFAAVLLFFRRGRERIASKYDVWFLSLAAFGPAALSALFAAVTGGEVLSSWTTPYYVASGVFLVMLMRPEPGRFRLKLFLIFFTVLSVIFAIVFGYEYLLKRPYLKKRIAYDTYPGRESAEYLTAEWRRRYNRPLKYAVGMRREACNLTFYSPDMPVSYFDADVALSQWIDPAEVDREGAVFLWPADAAPGWLEPYQGRLVHLPELEFGRAVAPWFRAVAGKTPPFRLKAAFLPPQKP